MLEDFLGSFVFEKGQIIAIATQDFYWAESLSSQARNWFTANLSSKKMKKLKLGYGFAMIGVFGGEPHQTQEKRSSNDNDKL